MRVVVGAVVLVVLLTAILVITRGGDSRAQGSPGAGDEVTPLAGPLYEVRENETAFEYPSEFPVCDARDRGKFDWKRYVDGGRSGADRMFRANLATDDYRYGVDGGSDSNSSQWLRYSTAAWEVAGKCDVLIGNCRRKLKDEGELLAELNEFVNLREKAMGLQVALIGGSWAGGSGERTAWAEARMKALSGYYRDLRLMTESLHLQDLP